MLHTKDIEIEKIIIENLGNININKITSNLEQKDISFINKLLDINITQDKKNSIIDGLRESGNIILLGSILVQAKDNEVKKIAAYNLLVMTGLDGFYDSLDMVEYELLEVEIQKKIDEKWNTWGWEWEKPKTVEGKKIALLICEFSALRIFDKYNKAPEEFIEIASSDRLAYLTTCFLVQKGVPFNQVKLKGVINPSARLNILKKYWKKPKKLNNPWHNFIRYSIKDDAIPLLIFTLGPYWLMSAFSLFGIVAKIFSFNNNILFYYYTIYSDFSLWFGIIYFVINTIMNYILDVGDRWWRNIIFGPLWILHLAQNIRSKIKTHFTKQKWYLSLIFILFLFIATSFFLPFHHKLLNILFLLPYLFLFMITIDEYQINLIFLIPHKLDYIIDIIQKDKVLSSYGLEDVPEPLIQ